MSAKLGQTLRGLNEAPAVSNREETL